MSRKILLTLIFFGLLFLIPIIKPSSSFAACSANWNFRGTTDGDWSVIYHLTLSDNCPGTNTYNVRVTNRTSGQPKLEGGSKLLEFRWGVGANVDNNDPVSVTVTDSRNIDITVHRDEDVFHPNGDYNYVIVRASNSEASNSIQLVYTVENKPDLKVIPEFKFAGGCIGDQSQEITLNITNTGWIAVPSKANGGGFIVRVHNGVGHYFDYEVKQRINRGDIVRIGNEFEGKVNIGRPAGTHTARAIIDLNNHIIEEDKASEKNNKATDDYISRDCTNTPTPTKPAGVTLTPTPTLPPGTTPTPTPRPSNDGWIEGTGGDMRLDRYSAPTFINIIPVASRFFSNTISNMMHGIVFLVSPFNISGTVDNIDKATNPPPQLVKGVPFKDPSDTKELNTSYNSVINNLKKTGIYSSTNKKDLSPACGGSILSCNSLSSISQGIYTAENPGSNVFIDSNTNFPAGPNNKYHIFVINGDLTIKNDIRVTPGTTAIFIVKKDIIIDPNVRVLEGIYSADSDFKINSRGAGLDDDLKINGSVIINAKGITGLGSLQGKRDLGARNSTQAGINIKYRPDFVLNSPLFLRTTNSKRVEIAPGE